MQQLSIFDAAPNREAFTVGDTVEVVVNVEEKDVEDYYYLQGYVGLRGKIVKLLSKMQYEVQYEKKERVGILRHGELERGKRDEQ